MPDNLTEIVLGLDPCERLTFSNEKYSGCLRIDYERVGACELQSETLTLDFRSMDGEFVVHELQRNLDHWRVRDDGSTMVETRDSCPTN